MILSYLCRMVRKAQGAQVSSVSNFLHICMRVCVHIFGCTSSTTRARMRGHTTHARGATRRQTELRRVADTTTHTLTTCPRVSAPDTKVVEVEGVCVCTVGIAGSCELRETTRLKQRREMRMRTCGLTR